MPRVLAAFTGFWPTVRPGLISTANGAHLRASATHRAGNFLSDSTASCHLIVASSAALLALTGRPRRWFRGTHFQHVRALRQRRTVGRRPKLRACFDLMSR